VVQPHLYMKFSSVPIIVPNISNLIPHVGLNYLRMIMEQLRDSKHSRFESSISLHKEGRQLSTDVGFPVKLS